MKRVNDFLLKHPVLEGVLSGVFCGMAILATFYIVLTIKGF